MIAGMLSQRSHFWFLVSIRVALLFNYPYFLYDIFFQPLLKPHSSSTKLITLYCQEKMVIMIFFFISSDIKRDTGLWMGRFIRNNWRKATVQVSEAAIHPRLPSLTSSASWVVPMWKIYKHKSDSGSLSLYFKFLYMEPRLIWDETYAAVSQPHLSDLAIYSQHCRFCSCYVMQVLFLQGWVRKSRYAVCIKATNRWYFWHVQYFKYVN